MFDILKLIDKMSGNLEIQMQTDNPYLRRFIGGESEKVNGNIVANPRNRYY